MEVYVEYVIVDNYVIDYLLLKLTHLERTRSVYKNGIHYGSAIGTLIALIIPLIKLPTLVLLLLKILFSATMLLASARYASFFQFIHSYLRFLAFTFIFGGAIYAIFSIINVDYSLLLRSTSVIPLGVIISLSALIYKCCYKLCCSLYERRLIYPFVRECELVVDGKRLNFSGLIDSGNQLVFDNFNSVNVASSRLAERLASNGLLLGKNIGSIEVKTISGRGKISLYRFDYLKIYFNGRVNIIEGPIIGIGESKINLSEQYDLILSAECAKGERYESIFG